MVAVGAVVVLGLVAAWSLGLLTPEPEEVSLAETVAAVQAAADERSDDADTAVDDAVPTATPVPAPTSVPTPEAAPAPTARPLTTTIDPPSGSTLLAGSWAIEASDTTFVGYRADSPTGEAVGRTRGVEGALVASDTEILAVDVTADMSTLASDSRFRDEHLGTEGLETQRFSTSRFVLVEPIAIDLDAVDGTSGEFEAMGELTVKNVTNPVTVALEGTIVGEKLVVVGSTELDLNDFGATISSIEAATMEFSLVFVRKT